MKKITPLILAGGSGTRLWPSSRNAFPKQFQSLYGDKTLFQNTLLRLKDLDTNDPIIIVNEEHKFIAKEQLDEINISGPIIIEPEAKNTCPAVTIGAHYLNLISKIDNYLFVLAADHVIKEEKKFLDARKVSGNIDSIHSSFTKIEKGVV